MKAVRVKVPLVRPMVKCSVKRALRLMPSVLLLLFVFGLIFLTLMQIAVIHAHRRTLYTQRSAETPSVTAPVTATPLPVRSVLVKGSQPAKRSEVMRVEAFVDKNAPTLEASMVSLQTDINVARLRQILVVVGARLRHFTNASSMFRTDHGVAGSLRRAASWMSTEYLNQTVPILGGINRTRNINNYNSSISDSSVVFAEKSPQSELCQPVPPYLVGRVKVNTNQKHSWSEIMRMNRHVRKGGAWSPSNCRSRHRVAVIIPYRDREEHLLVLFYQLLPILQRQQLEFRVYVVEQHGNDTFNKGVLMNGGVREALKDADFHCFVFHDVDMIPEDDRNMYTCPESPRHMSVGVDKFNYSLPYPMLVGGVFAIKTEHFALANGYSNLYWGWGGEDDDMAYRIKYRKLNIIRPPESIARYTMIKHDHRAESPNNVRSALLRMSKRRSGKDGLNSVKYKLASKTAYPLYTHLLVDIGNNHRWKFINGKKLVISF